MASFIVPDSPQGPARGVGTLRQQQLLKSARAQLGAILEGPEAPPPNDPFWQEVVRLQGTIEKLLGY